MLHVYNCNHFAFAICNNDMKTLTNTLFKTDGQTSNTAQNNLDYNINLSPILISLTDCTSNEP